MTQALTAGAVCTRDVSIAFRSTALYDAARSMRERHVGSLVVVDETPEGRVVVGLLTDRDIVTAVVAKEVDARTLSVEDVMSADVATVREDDSLHDVVAQMKRRRVRRLPVVTAQDRLVGMIAADDVLRALAADFQALVQAIGEQSKIEQLIRP
jgi:CBS domain-containing protein